MRPESVRLDRFRSGRAPLLDSHRAGSIADQIGVITGARIESDQLTVRVKLSDRNDDRMKQIRADLAAGVIRNVSVGYSVYASEEAEGAGGMSVIIRTDWEPAELSLVSIPADPQAHIRSMKGKSMDKTAINDDTDTREADPIESAALASDDGSDISQVRRTMSDRHAREAYTIAARAGFSAEFARQHIESGVTLKEFRTIILNEKANEADRSRTVSFAHQGEERSFNNPEFLGQSIEQALYARMTGKAPEGAARELMGRSLLDMGSLLLQANGERVSWSNREALASQILTRNYHTTSDFPVLLTGAGNRVLLDAYKAAECPLKRLARRRNAADFRPLSLGKLSEAPRLQKVGEAGEVTYGSRSEAKEGFKVETFARIFSLSRQAIINDDLGAFADSNMAWGRAAAETEADLLVSLFTANSGNGVNLDDGNPIYTTGRKNKAAAGAALDVTTLGAGRQAMRETKGLDGKTPIGVTPRHLVVGPAKETQAEQVLAAIAAAQVADANPFSGKLTLHVEPRFTGNGWRIFADPAELATIVIAYLNGREGPVLETREGWTTLGAEFRAVLDFGCGIADWRGTYLNPGE
ncbi:MAG: Mu-like prophage major head subunit gpT family protein [Pseudorhodoplanes sp.]|nr:Mu-like prophage major head subunit gpT family protein [Pseudorhodoplanes sp.]